VRAIAASVVLLFGASALADELPIALQVQLLSKTSAYVTTLQPGEDGKVKVLVVHAGASAARGSESLAGAINQAGTIGKFPAEAKLVPVADVKAAIASEKPQFVWLAPELDEKGAQAVIDACGAASIVTVSVNGAHVKQGVILGFELAEARPRILVHLKQARAQNVVFLSGLLTHSVIVER
jgi:hypothetical protein